MKISSVELKQMGNKHPDQNHLHTLFHALADLTDEVAALRAEVDEKLTFLAGCGDDLKARVEGLEKRLENSGEFCGFSQDGAQCWLKCRHQGPHSFYSAGSST